MADRFPGIIEAMRNRSGKRWMGWAARSLAVVALLGGVYASAHRHVQTHTVPEGEVAPGFVLEGEPVTAGQTAEALADEAVSRRLGRSVLILDAEGKTPLLEGTLRDLGATTERARLVAKLTAVGHRGDVWQRLEEAEHARRGQIGATLRWRLPATAIVEALIPYKESHEREPVDARWDFDEDRVIPHEEGSRIDPYDAVAAIRAAVEATPEGPIEVTLPVERRIPAATTEVVAAVDRSVVLSEYETVYGYVGSQVGRAKNVARAAAGVNGLVMMPGAVYSFNDLVGPRSIENGFDRAGEIYKGELRMGIGGGTCQVASTLHAAAYFSGLDVVQRAPHSRPSGYIGIGLDATVAYPTVDLKLRNPYPFPVVVRARGEKGRMKVQLLGKEQPAEVDHHASTVAVKMYKRKIRRSPWLEEGKVFRKQKGRKGVTIEKVRTIEFADGGVKEERTRDVYPPTNEIYYLPPGADEDEALPPLPSG